MSKRINLTPQQLQSIINTMEDMRSTLVNSSTRLQTDTSNIKRAWDDDQFESFQSTVLDILSHLKIMSERMDKEKQRLINYQRDTQSASDNFSR